MTNVIPYPTPRTSVAVLLQDLRRLTDEQTTLRTAAVEAEANLKAMRRANRHAWANNGGPVASEWTAAIGRRVNAALSARAELAGPTWRLACRLSDARHALGAPLSRLDKREARRLYREAFPELSPHKAAAEVNCILSGHRFSQQMAGGVR